MIVAEQHNKVNVNPSVVMAGEYSLYSHHQCPRLMVVECEGKHNTAC